MHYPDEAICGQLHDFELPSVRADKTYLYLDAVMSQYEIELLTARGM